MLPPEPISFQSTPPSTRKPLRTETAPVRWLIIGIAVTFLVVFLVLPLFTVFQQAFSRGIEPYFEALGESDALAAIQLTLLVASVSVAANLVFGLVAAWAITRFEF